MASLSEFWYNPAHKCSVPLQHRHGRSRDRDVVRNRFVGALRGGDVWLQDCGSRVGKWERKCLQRAIIECCNGSMRAAAEYYFRKRCQNNSNSGAGGNQVEVRNFNEVLSFLSWQKCCLRVFTSACRASFSLGYAFGGWVLGESSGRCLGDIAWLGAEKHVMLLKGDCAGFGELVTNQVQPWYGSVVGAPKGRMPKRQTGRSTEEMRCVTDARETSRRECEKVSSEVSDGFAERVEDTNQAPPWYGSVVGAPKGRGLKKKRAVSRHLGSI